MDIPKNNGFDPYKERTNPTPTSIQESRKNIDHELLLPYTN